MNRTILGAEIEYLLAFHRLRRGDSDRIGPHALVELAMREPHLLAEEAGLFLPNGGRLYADPTGHIEFCTPECETPGDLVRYIRAGDRLVSRLVRRLQESLPHVESLLSATNVDDGGNTWGFHENYLIQRPLECYDKPMQHFLPSRMIYGGGGGLDPLSSGVVFSLSPRSRHITRLSSHSSTEQRPLFHLKDEPLSAEYGRLHLLCGEALNSDFGLRLRFGATALIVRLIDHGEDPSEGIELLDPLKALRMIALDVEGRQTVDTRSGPMTALALQRRYLERVLEGQGRGWLPGWAPEIIQDWSDTLDSLEHDPTRLEGMLDWALKKRLFDDIATEIYGLNGEMIEAINEMIHAFRGKRRSATIGSNTVRKLVALLEKEGLSPEALQSVVALRYHLLETDIRFSQPEDGYFAELDRLGQLTHHIPGVDTETIEKALETPPVGGRAQVRGKFVREHGHEVERYAIGWMRISNRENGSYLNLENPFETAAQWSVSLSLSEEATERVHGEPEAPSPIQTEIGRLHDQGKEAERRGDLRAAESLYRQAQEMARENACLDLETHCRLHVAVICDQLGRWSEARALVLPILMRSDGEAEREYHLNLQVSLLIELRLALRMGENLSTLESLIGRVQATFTGTYDERKRRADLDCCRAELLLLQGKPDEALLVLRNLREADGSRALRIRAYLMRNDTAQAEYALEQWKANGLLVHQRPIYYALLAEAYARRNEARQAVRSARKALTEAEARPSIEQAQKEATLHAQMAYARALLCAGRVEPARKSVDFVLDHEALQSVQLRYEAGLLCLDCALAQVEAIRAQVEAIRIAGEKARGGEEHPALAFRAEESEGESPAWRAAEEIYMWVASLGHALDESLNCRYRHVQLAERYQRLQLLKAL
ncbi:MAG TPA: proteasome accessory factor PafA2 family protein [Chthonomonadaceae bacterium]|nr:proteasome accessory factor PafA2 family protein [Chthonomonadaceae bacterium]